MAVAIISTNFPDATFREYVQSTIMGDASAATLTDEKIASTKKIDVKGKDISDLTGIECFTSLEVLDCSSTNVSKITFNSPTLKELYCKYTKISALDITKYSQLTTLDCSFNQLTTLNLSENIPLVSVNCSDNNISELDLSKNTNLTVLNCGNNDISSLDVSKNTALEELQFYNNQVKTINVSSNTELKVLVGYSTGIRTLDLSNNEELTELDVYDNFLSDIDLSYNSKLLSLYCDNNNLTELDLSHNQKLQSLSCSANKLDELDLRRNTKLTVIGCGGNNLKELDLAKNTLVKALECSDNKLTSLDLSKNKELATLWCKGNELISLDLSSCIDKLVHVECENQSPKKLIYTATGENEYPYQIDMATTVGNYSKDNVSDIHIYGSSDEELNASYNEGIAKVSSTPVKMTYNCTYTYDTDKTAVLSATATEPLVQVIIKTPALTDAVMDSEYNLTPTTTGNTPIEWSSPNLPEGLSIDPSTGKLYGTPTVFGLYDIEFVAKNIVTTSRKTLTLDIGVALTETYFPDTNFRNYVKSTVIRNDNALVLTASKIDSTKDIDVHNKNITSLKGIEYFTKLTKLLCFSNQLTTLDVSKNTALTELQCYRNQLTSLDVSKNTALTQLRCFENNLSSLVVSKNTALTVLSCGENQLTSLDVSKNITLTELSCYNNQLTMLDVSKNTALERLDCCNNQLTSLDVSKNTALKELYCFDNLLTSLDVSKNAALTALYCGNNNLASLDVSKNTALASLLCNNNKLTYLDVSKNTALTQLRCYDNNITEIGIDDTSKLLELECANQYKNIVTTAVKGNVAYPYKINLLEQIGNRHYNEEIAFTCKNSSNEEIPCAYESGSVYMQELPAVMHYQYSLPIKDSKTASFDVQLDIDGLIPSISTDVIRHAIEGTDYSETIETIGTLPITVTAAEVPEGLSIDQETATISGNPTADGHYTVALTASNAFGEITKNVPFDVDERPVITSHEIADGEETVDYTFTMSATGTVPVTWRSTELPEGLTLNSETGTISGKPTTPGVYKVKVTATNVADSYEKDLEIVVMESLESLAEGDVAITAENFPDRTFRTYIRNEIVQNPAASILRKAKIDNTISVEVFSRGIKSLKGIEFLTRLLQIRCYDNELTELDVTKNTNVQYLDCSDNKLTELDVTKNPDLIWLYCSSNKLTSLDVTKNPKLLRLWCWNNILTALDTSKNTVLDLLYCYTNKIAALNVTTNTKLREFECQENELSELDVTKNTSLTRLECYDNKITTLDVSKNTALQKLRCNENKLTTLNVTSNTALDFLSCSENELTSLDVSKNTLLKHLYCSHNNLTALNITANTALEKLYCDENNISTLDITKNLQLTDIDCRTNNIVTLNTENNTKLEGLTCSNNRISALNLAKSTGLNYLHCSNNLLMTIDLSKNTNLTDIAIYNNKLSELDISYNKKLKSLDCSHNRIMEISLAANTALEELNCENNRLTKLDVSKNSNLNYLQCSIQRRSDAEFIDQGGTYQFRIDLTQYLGEENRGRITRVECKDGFGNPIESTYSNGVLQLKGMPLSMKYVYEVAANDVAKDTFDVTISSPEAAPVITTVGFEPAIKGTAYEALLTATGTAPIVWEVIDIPDGLTLNKNTGLLTGTPLVDGVFTIVAVAENPADSVTKEFSMTIYARPAVVNKDFHFATEGVPYSAKIDVSGTQPITTSVADLPEGLSFDPNTNVISGIATIDGNYTITIDVTNVTGTITKQFDFDVNEIPAITTSSLPTAVREDMYDNLLTATGTRPLKWSGKNLPAGLSVDEDIGKIVGIPEKIGTYHFEITVENMAGSNTIPLSLYIIEKATFLIPRLPNLKKGAKHTIKINTTGSAPISLSFLEGNLPPGMVFDPATNTIEGTPTEYGTYSFTIRASNPAGHRDKIFTPLVTTRTKY